MATNKGLSVVRSAIMLAVMVALALGSPAATGEVKPEMWAPGVISTPLDEFGGALTPDGKEFYFSISVPRFFLEVMCQSTLKNGRWTKPVVSPWSGKHHEFDPCLSPDGKKLFFVSDRPVHGENKTDYDIWMMNREGSHWGAPIHLPDSVNSPGNEHFASCDGEGNLYVCSDRDGKTNKVYFIPFKDGQYGKAEALPDEINGEGHTLESSISPDGKILVSAIIGRKDSLGLYDLYISFKEGDKWTPMKNLGPRINTKARDYTPRITTDGKWLFYTSENGFWQQHPGRLSYEELNKGVDSLMNGYGNIYRIPTSEVLKMVGR